jgi:hypothetical protein
MTPFIVTARLTGGRASLRLVPSNSETPGVKAEGSIAANVDQTMPKKSSKRAAKVKEPTFEGLLEACWQLIETAGELTSDQDETRALACINTLLSDLMTLRKGDDRRERDNIRAQHSEAFKVLCNMVAPLLAADEILGFCENLPVEQAIESVRVYLGLRAREGLTDSEIETALALYRNPAAGQGRPKAGIQLSKQPERLAAAAKLVGVKGYDNLHTRHVRAAADRSSLTGETENTPKTPQNK